MVFASRPVLSPSRLAARPVGAARAISTPLEASTLRMALINVVLPTPGPPVMTRTLESRASRSAARWLSASVTPALASTQGIAFAGSTCGQGSAPS